MNMTWEEFYATQQGICGRLDVDIVRLMRPGNVYIVNSKHTEASATLVNPCLSRDFKSCHKDNVS